MPRHRGMRNIGPLRSKPGTQLLSSARGAIAGALGAALLASAMLVGATAAETPRTAEASLTYQPLTCHLGRTAEWNAAGMLDTAWGAGWDAGMCPITGIFRARHGYDPVFGSQTSILDNYGRVIVRQSGECGFMSDTSGVWDFQVPCKAHDYCYDLIRAGFNGTVTKGDCDNNMRNLMEADCEDRSYVPRQACRAQKEIAYRFVVELGGIGPSPSPVAIRSVLNNKCADIPYGNPYNGVRLQQWTCWYTGNQLFRFHAAPGYPGYFHIKPASAPSKCIAKWGTFGYLADYLEQFTCFDYWSSERWKIDDVRISYGSAAYYENQFTLRSDPAQGGWCIDIPYSSWADGQQLTAYGHCHEGPNQRWRLS